MEKRASGTVKGSARIGGAISVKAISDGSISSRAKTNGAVSEKKKLSATISAEVGLYGEVENSKQTDTLYMGEYTVTPKNYEETVLETRGKKMTDNVTVLKIPKYEVSNQSGGETLIIGDEYYGS